MAKKTPTQQQLNVIAAVIDPLIRFIKIMAAAGAGKTSTLIMSAEALEEQSIYLCFNKVTQTEAEGKFPDHVEPRTGHSLAWDDFGSKLQSKMKRPAPTKTVRYTNVAFTGGEIGRYFDIGDMQFEEGLVIGQSFLGMLARKTVENFEQSADTAVEMKHVPTHDLKEKLNGDYAFIARAKDKILWAAKMLWTERKDKDSVVLITPDTYLKLYQLSKPVMKGRKLDKPTVLYVDEFQDTTPCVLDIIMNQKDRMKIIVVGDNRQAIYGWRGAVNAMQMVDAPTYPLTKSFRFGQVIADLATVVLERDMVITGNEAIPSIQGAEKAVKRNEPYTRLFRTNASLLGSAIDAIKAGRSVNIEIDTKDFVKFLESAQALYIGDSKNVKHDKLLAYQDWDEAKAESKHDPDIGRAVMVIENGLIEDWIETLQGHRNVLEPHITFTTAHKSKGREWNQVIVENDFKSCYNEDGEWKGLSTEEQNLLYVALTRAVLRLQTNKTIREYMERGTLDDYLPLEIATRYDSYA